MTELGQGEGGFRGWAPLAGVAHNKILAKFASGMHKPAQQTVVTLAAVPGLLATTPIPKLRQLGGKFGEEIMHALQITTVGACNMTAFYVATVDLPLVPTGRRLHLSVRERRGCDADCEGH